MNGIPFVRTAALEDIRIRSGGDGRTVEAYAAVFDSPAPISDQDGHYLEVNHREAFSRTIKQHGGRFPVIYNHGMTAMFTPSERGSVPIGVSVEAKTDSKGLLTVARYGTSELADEVLEAIRDGRITAQSYGGRYLRSDPTLRRGQRHRPAGDGSLRTVTRLEIAMHEFGPTPFPAFSGAEIVGVRAALLAGALGAGVTWQQDAATPRDGDSVFPQGTPDGTRPTAQGDSPTRHSDLRDHIRRQRIIRGI